MAALFKAMPIQFFAKFDIAPQLVTFKYLVGSVVQPKLHITSSAMIGVKCSEVNLEKQAFVITEQIAYLPQNF